MAKMKVRAMSAPLRVLILENESHLSAHLGYVVEDTVAATVVITTSVAVTNKVLHAPFHFAFLATDVTDGKTYDIARQLEAQQVPYAFVSDGLEADLPSDLRGGLFIRKPFGDAQIEMVVLAADALRQVRRPASALH
jgi:hypothetical protein